METEVFHILEVFPEEIWLNILEYVREENVYRKVCSSSPYLKHLLQTRRTQVLFPKAFGSIVDKISFPKSDILRLRLVCQLWKSGVDQTQQNVKLEELIDEEINHKIFNISEKFVELGRMLEFQQKFDSSHLSPKSNPLLTRAAYFLTPRDINFLTAYYQAWFTILQKYGNYIWHCQIGHHIPKHEHQVDFYTNKLPKILELMPNLKVFCFVSGTLVFPHTVVDFERNANTFPKLSYLQFLRTYGMPLPIFREFIHSNPHLKSIDATHSGDYHLKLCLEKLPNLTLAAIKISSKQSFQLFRRAKINCQITKLNLDVKILNVQWEKLFESLQTHLSGSLKELSICLPRNQFCGGYLTLSKLEVLHLRLWKAAPLEFLLPIKHSLRRLSLELMEVYICGIDKVPETTINSIYEFWHEPCRSNIWSEFPKLRVLKTWGRLNFEYKWVVCHREEWRKWHSRKHY